jgi:hypothetical protein
MLRTRGILRQSINAFQNQKIPLYPPYSDIRTNQPMQTSRVRDDRRRNKKSRYSGENLTMKAPWWKIREKNLIVGSGCHAEGLGLPQNQNHYHGYCCSLRRSTFAAVRRPLSSLAAPSHNNWQTRRRSQLSLFGCATLRLVTD